MVLEKTLESPLDCEEIQPVHPKWNQSCVFIGMTDVEDEIPVLWPPDAESWLIRKDPHAGKDWRWEEEGTTEDMMVGWHHQLSGHEFWVNYGSWWWTGRPGMLQSVGLQRVGHKWATELNWWYLFMDICFLSYHPISSLQAHLRDSPSLVPQPQWSVNISVKPVTLIFWSRSACGS